MSTPPRTSTEPTLVIPRDALPPVKRVDREAPTMVPCPACEGDGMVTIERKGFILEKLAEPIDTVLVELDEPGEQR